MKGESAYDPLATDSKLSFAVTSPSGPAVVIRTRTVASARIIGTRPFLQQYPGSLLSWLDTRKPFVSPTLDLDIQPIGPADLASSPAHRSITQAQNPVVVIFAMCL